MSSSSVPPAIVLGVKPDGTTLHNNLLPRISELIKENWKNTETKGKPLETKVFFNLDKTTVVAVGLGEASDELSVSEKTELTRKVVATGAKALKEHISNTREVLVDHLWSPHAAAVGATLGTFHYNVKTKQEAVQKRKSIVYKPLLDSSDSSAVEKGDRGKSIGLDWSTGLIFGQAQNLARELMETGANLMTPTKFCERIKKEFQGLANVEIHVREKSWAENSKMNSFLSVARGTEEPCKFLEIHYKGTKSASGFKPSIAFVGKGITFDSGGISLKPGAGMKLMRADMGGAATVTSAAWAIAKLGIEIDLLVCTPLTENMPSGHATKPGDIIYAMNGKSIEVDNTDAEGRLVLADALYYASSVYKPQSIIDCATLTGAMVISLGEPFSGLFSTSDELWKKLDAAGRAEHDRFWRMPFDDFYMKQIDTSNADLCNTGGRIAGSCTAAIFLREFVDGLACNAPEGSHQTEDEIAYAHIDIAGAMECTIPDAYNPKGLTGRPVRALIEYVRQAARK